MPSEKAPITRGQLAVHLAYEAALVTEAQAAELLGWGNDIVGFRGRHQYVLAEVAPIATPGHLPNFAREGPPCHHRHFSD